jgi:hypothetical protein
MPDQPEAQPTHEKPLFLAPKARVGDGRGYVNRPEMAMRQEPECIGPAILDSYAESNAFLHSQRHAADVLTQRQIRPLLRAEDRLKDAERRARQAKRRDLKGEFLALNGMLAHYRKTDGEPKPGSSVLNRLERVEAKLDGLEQAA